MAIISIAAIIG